MPNTTSYDFGDVVLMEQVFTNQVQTQKRPAVVVSTQAYNRRYPDIVVMPITSQKHQALKHGAVPVADQEQAGLIQPSFIKLVIVTYEANEVIRQLGKLDQFTRIALKKAIAGIFGFKQAGSST